jgi:hypothetical protein
MNSMSCTALLLSSWPMPVLWRAPASAAGTKETGKLELLPAGGAARLVGALAPQRQLAGSRGRAAPGGAFGTEPSACSASKVPHLAAAAIRALADEAALSLAAPRRCCLPGAIQVGRAKVDNGVVRFVNMTYWGGACAWR